DDKQSARVLLQPQGDFIKTCLVLVVDSRRVEREEDWSARHEYFDRRYYRLGSYRHGSRATAAGTRLVATSVSGADVYGYGNRAGCSIRQVESDFSPGC